MIALRTYARYFVLLTLLALVVHAPLAYLAYAVPVPRTAAHAHQLVRLALALPAVAWMLQLWLVGAAAPLAASVASGAPLSQLAALRAAALGLARGLVPWLAALAAILVGLLALVVPGLILLALFARTAGSGTRVVRTALAGSARAVRDHLALVIGILVALVLVDVGIAVVAKLALTSHPLPKKLDPRVLAPYRDLVRIAAIAPIVVAPLFAALLAAVGVRSGK